MIRLSTYSSGFMRMTRIYWRFHEQLGRLQSIGTPGSYSMSHALLSLKDRKINLHKLSCHFTAQEIKLPGLK
jgi:hypothetical protein